MMMAQSNMHTSSVVFTIFLSFYHYSENILLELDNCFHSNHLLLVVPEIFVGHKIRPMEMKMVNGHGQ